MSKLCAQQDWGTLESNNILAMDEICFYSPQENDALVIIHCVLARSENGLPLFSLNFI